MGKPLSTAKAIACWVHHPWGWAGKSTVNRRRAKCHWLWLFDQTIDGYTAVSTARHVAGQRNFCSQPRCDERPSLQYCCPAVSGHLPETMPCQRHWWSKYCRCLLSTLLGSTHTSDFSRQPTLMCVNGFLWRAYELSTMMPVSIGWLNHPLLHSIQDIHFPNSLN